MQVVTPLRLCVCPSLCLSHRSTAAATGGGLAAERPAGRTYRSIAAGAGARQQRRGRSEVMCELACMYVCMSVCLSLRTHIAGTVHVKTCQIFVYVTQGRRLVLVWWRCDTICTPGFVMNDVTFPHSGNQSINQSIKTLIHVDRPQRDKVHMVKIKIKKYNDTQ